MDLYSDLIIDLAKNPLHREELTPFTHAASGVNTTCGDHLRIQLHVQDEVIQAATWMGDGCAISVAAASVLTDALVGQTLSAVREWPREKALELLEIAQLGPARMKCATLCMETAEQALNSSSSSS